MKAVLMHKNIEVAVIDYQDGLISDVREILNRDHMPIGTYLPTMQREMCSVYLQAWQRTRAIPMDRTNLPLVMETTGRDVFQLGMLAHGMGLTDQYWIRKGGESLIWEDVCFSKNGFEPSLLTLVGKGEAAVSPDYETNGSLPKSWILLDRVPILLKDSPDWLCTASANEVVASQLAKLAGIEHAEYFPLSINGKMLCASPCFVEGDQEEFVSLQMYLRTHRIASDIAAEQMGLPEEFLQNMTAFDLMMGNTDRHEGNFGVMINPDTMAYLRPAPLFDSGTSLHQCTGETDDFKPFWRSRAKALKQLGIHSLKFPSEQEISRIVESTYSTFGLQAYVQYAVDELCGNIQTLNNRELAAEFDSAYQEVEDDLCW